MILGKPRAHFSDRARAIKAADRSLELVSGDYEFLPLLYDVSRDTIIEKMENTLSTTRMTRTSPTG